MNAEAKHNWRLVSSTELPGPLRPLPHDRNIECAVDKPGVLPDPHPACTVPDDLSHRIRGRQGIEDA
jgi:hypothetical protein